MKKRKIAALLTTAICLCALSGWAEEKPDANSVEEAEARFREVNDQWEQIGEEYAPEIRTLKNGVKVQRTPTEYQCYHWNRPYEKGTTYNNYFLDADHRGCNACHVDLADTMKNMKYTHPTIWNDELGNWISVGQCMLCHSADDGDEMGTVFHAVHYGSRNGETFAKMGGNCMSCHNMTESKTTGDRPEIELWDLVKYDHLDGINKVADVPGEFTFTQDRVQNNAEMFTYDWIHSHWDHIMHIMGKHGSNTMLPQDMIDNWEFAVHGEVNAPFTMTRKELIAAAEAEGVSVTKVSKIHCVDNMPGGAGISNVEITGFPVSWLIEKAGGIKEDATGVIFDRWDEGSVRGVKKGEFEKCFIVYQIGGQELTMSQGSPLMTWYEGADAQSYVKQVTGLNATAEAINYDAKLMNGFNFYGDGEWINKPNATILKCPDGMIIPTGKPFTFEGFADAYDERITSIEFSMDRGKTWTKFDLPETDPNKVLFWAFTWTPETDASYVLSVRATTETGLVSPTNYGGYHCTMVTARSDMEEL